MNRSSRTTAILLLLGILWVCISEIGVPYVFASQWEWPELSPTGNLILEDPPGVSVESLAAHRRHYHNEDTHYYMSSHSAEGKGETGKLALRILIFSDPHIMCTFNKNELWLARKDSDRYLSTMYSHLTSTLKPNVIVLLGDIFSDGFQASADQWKDYLMCLKNVFPPLPGVEVVVAFGDNDLGGEGRDLMSETTTKRYIEAFGPLNMDYSIGGMKFIKLTSVCYISEMPSTQAERECRKDLELFLKQHRTAFRNDAARKLVLTHIPLHLSHAHRRFHELREMVMDQVQPNYVFSGHIHKEHYSTHVLWQEGRRGKAVRKLAHEITVPTCSYRNGKQYMGVGAAVIGAGGDLAYRVMWLPPRYPFVASYAVLLVVLLLWLCWSSCTNKRNQIC